MCCFSRRIDRVSNTNIFARAGKDNNQFLVYAISLSSKDDFKEVKAIKDGGKIDDPVLARAIDVIYLAYLEKQLDAELLKKMTALGNAVEQKFNTFRAKVGDKELTLAEVRDILKVSTLSERRKEVWEASKEVGKVVELDLKELVKMRNEAAKVTYDAWHYVNLIPGHELQYTLPNGNRVYGAAYLHEYRLYILKASLPANGIPPLLYTQSFASVRSDGSAIRYAKIYRHPW